VYHALGDSQTALDFYNQSLRLRREVGDKAGEATTLNNIGAVYDALGDKQQALEKYNQSLPLRREVGDKAGEATTLNNIGFVYDDLGDKQQALEKYNQSLPLWQQVGDKAGEAATLNNIGKVYSDLGDKQRALSFYNQSLPLRGEVEDKAGVATTLNNIGKVYDDLGDKQQALSFYNQSLPLLREVGDKAGEAGSLFNFAILKRSQGNLTEALTDMELAIKIIEELRTKIISQDLRTSYFSTVYGYYEFYIDLLMELHKQNPNQGYDAKALHASERGRARSLLDILAESGANIKEGVDPQLLAEEQKLLQRLNALDQSRQLNPGERDIEELKQEIETVRRQLQTLEVEIKRNSPQYANLQYPEPLTAEEIQQQVLDEETVLLLYSLGRDRSFLWLVSSTEVKSYQLPKRAEIEQLSQSFLAEIESRAVIPPSGEELSQVLLSPVINQLGNKRLVIVGDGILQTVPFAALPLTSPPALSYEERGQIVSSRLFINGEGGKKMNHASLLAGRSEGGYTDNSSPLSGRTEEGYTPLIVQHEIITLPSASSLAILREQVEGRTPAPKKVAVIADPVFAENDPRFQADYQASTPINNVNLIVLRQAISDDFLGKNLGRLGHTRAEAEAILALVPDDLEQLSLDFDANRQAATDSNLSQYQIVHFATHGLLNETQPELSGLVFSLYDQQGVENPGFLQLNDIFNLTLSADLVVLSACETGVGQEIRGEGLVSLTRGFMYAGAERIVVSLWAVADSSTSEFMQDYYRKILDNNSNPATAMRETQLEMLQSDQFNAPYFWAAFVFQGEWKRGIGNRQ
ncbi:MAG: CHAT domain-containing tetratricopeptide repeat protein, partial [Microcoleaceae cyanobacterium]